MLGPRLKTLLQNLALSAIVSVVLLGALEGGARWIERRRLREDKPELFPDWGLWQDGFYRLGANGPHWPLDRDVNRDGLRDSHHTVEQPAGTTRLLFLGDSVTYGFGLRAENAYPQRLQRLLDERGERLEVFNVAAPGWTPRQERVAYASLARPYGARHAIVAVCLNDLLELHLNLARPAPLLLELHRRSALFRRLVNAAGREVRSIEELERQPEGALARAALERLEQELGTLRDELRADRVSLAAIVFPYRFQMRPGATTHLQREIRAVLTRLELPHEDLTDTLLPLGTAAFGDYNHLSAIGTEAVAQALLAGTLLPARPSHAQSLRKAGLGAGDEPGAAPRLLAALASQDDELRAAAAWALHRQRRFDEAWTPALSRLCSDPSEPVRIAAARALERAQPTLASRAALASALDDAREAVRLAAARGLWAQGASVAEAPALAAALAHADPYVRVFAEEALVRIGVPAAASVVLRLSDPQAAVRRRAARVAGRLGPAARATERPLLALLDDADAGTRRVAARALGQLGSSPSVQSALERCAAQDPDARVRAAAALALGHKAEPAPDE